MRVGRIKITLLAFFIFLLRYACAQEATDVFRLESWESLSRGRGIIYGKFIEGFGTHKWSTKQHICVQNVGTKQMFYLRIENQLVVPDSYAFIFSLPPGKYNIVAYWIYRPRLT